MGEIPTNAPTGADSSRPRRVNGGHSPSELSTFVEEALRMFRSTPKSRIFTGLSSGDMAAVVFELTLKKLADGSQEASAREDLPSLRPTDSIGGSNIPMRLGE